MADEKAKNTELTSTKPARNKKSVIGLSATEKKVLILEALAKEGYSPYQAAQLLNVSKQLTYRIDKQMRQGLLAPFVAKAKTSLGLLLEGKPVGDMKLVKGSDVTTAIRMVVDRVDPIVTRIEQKSLSIRGNLNDDEREKYHKLLGVAPQLPELPDESNEGEKE